MEAGEIIELKGKKYLVIGKTFSTQEEMEVGDTFLLEAETINLEKDTAPSRAIRPAHGGATRDGAVLKLTAWVPNFIEKVDSAEPDSVEDVIKRARRHGVLQEKVRGEGGRVEYLPTETGDPKTAFKSFPLKAGFEDYPDENEDLRYVFQLHFRGKSCHGDFRAEYKRGDINYLKGMTVALQQEGTIKRPVESMEAAEREVKRPENWKMDLKTGLIKPRKVRGGAIRTRGNLRAFPKAAEIPRDWLEVQGITERPDPGEPPPVGATRFHPGVFVIVAKGKVEWGAQKPLFMEFFLDGDWKGRWTFRVLERETKAVRPAPSRAVRPAHRGAGRAAHDGAIPPAHEGTEILPEGVEEEGARTKIYWVLMQPLDPTPYVLSQEAIEKEWLPPKGISCLPRAIRERVPEGLRFWEHSGEKALKLRAELAKMDLREIGVPELSPTGVKALDREWHKYVLQRHWFRGPIVIRFGPSEEHYDLRVAEDGRHYHLVLDGNPLVEEGLPAYEEEKESGTVLTVSGEEIPVMEVGERIELKPGQPANPTIETPAFLEKVDGGEVRILDEKPEFRKFEFRGGKLKGAWVFRRTEAGGILGEFSRSSGPETKSGLYLVQPHARLIFEGQKTAIVKARKFDVLGQDYYLLENNRCYGIIRLREPRAISLTEFKELRDQHRISDEERKRWWPHATELWYYEVERFEPFEEPRKVKVPRGIQNFVRKVTFLKEAEMDFQLKDEELGRAVRVGSELRNFLEDALESIENEDAAAALEALRDALDLLDEYGTVYGYGYAASRYGYGYGKRPLGKAYGYNYGYGGYYPVPKRLNVEEFRKLLNRAIVALEEDKPDFEKARGAVEEALVTLGYVRPKETKAGNELRDAVEKALMELDKEEPDFQKVAQLLKEVLSKIESYPEATKSWGLTAIKALEDTKDRVRIGGYLLLWGKKDLVGDYFTPETQLWLEEYKTVPILFQHGFDDVIGIEVIGHRFKAVPDDIGVWVEGWLEKSHKYWKFIEALLKKGVLYLSPGSAPHLVKRAEDGRLLSYPAVEDTLTVMPAQPRLRPVEVLSESYKAAGLPCPSFLSGPFAPLTTGPFVEVKNLEEEIKSEREALKKLLEER